MQILQPASWPEPKGYANGILAKGELIFVAGQIGWDDTHVFRSPDFAGQARQALLNILTVLEQAGAAAEHIVSMTWFITDRQEYLESRTELGKFYREIMGHHYPAMSMVEVVNLMEKRAKVEIESCAVIPE